MQNTDPAAQTSPPPPPEAEGKQPDPTLQLPRATYYQTVHTLHGLLPPPAIDTAEDLAHRDDAVIAHACHRA